MKKKKMILILTVILVLSLPFFALAAEEPDASTETDALIASDPAAEKYVDTGNNAMFAGETVSVDGGVFFGGFGMGQDITVRESSFEDTVFLAGRSISMNDSKIGGSLVCGGYDLTLSNNEIDGNIISGAYSVNIGEKVSSNAVISGSRLFSFSGTANALNVGAERAVINGIVNGDAKITADSVVISSNAKITGKLTVEASSEPEISNQASIGSYEFNQIETTDDDYPAEAASSFGSKAKSALYWAAAMLIIAMLMCWLTPKQITGAGEMLKARTGAVLGSGAVALVAVPVTVLLLCFTVIGIPCAMLLLIAYILLMCTAVMFSGATLARLVFPRMNPFLSSAIGVIVLEIAVKVPYLGGLIRIAAIIYTMGTFLQFLWTGRAVRHRDDPGPADPTEVFATERFEDPMISDDPTISVEADAQQKN